MAYLGTYHVRSAATCVAAMLGLIVSSEALRAEVGCLPPSPNACAADGICRPNQASFGYVRTRWRPWPGDPLPKQPTLADDTKAEEEMELEPFEHPTPEKEDIRGPAKTKSFTPPEEEELQESPDEGDPFADPDLQGSIPAEPQQDDAPPELPRGLRRYVASGLPGQISVSQTLQTSHSDRLDLDTHTRQSANLGTRQRLQGLPPTGSAIVQVASREPARFGTK